MPQYYSGHFTVKYVVFLDYLVSRRCKPEKVVLAVRILVDRMACHFRHTYFNQAKRERNKYVQTGRGGTEFAYSVFEDPVFTRGERPEYIL